MASPLLSAGLLRSVGLMAANRPVAIRLDPTDDVAVALIDLGTGVPSGIDGIAAREPIPAGHKLALRALAPGSAVRKFGLPIGRATAAIRCGEHVHLHNLAFAPEIPHDGPVIPTWDAREPMPEVHFLGYRRADGSVGTRNYLGIIPTVNCARSEERRVGK